MFLKLKIRERLGQIFFRKEGGKKVLNKFRAGVVPVTLVMIGMGVKLYRDFHKSTVSMIRESNTSLLTNRSTLTPSRSNSAPSVGGVMNHAPQIRHVHYGHIKIRYEAKQVISPGVAYDKLPIGSNFIGKFVASVDTRAPAGVQVTLPYGAAHKAGGGSLPPETILFGNAKYPGHGDRVYINFDHGLLPDGDEFKINAKALSSKDYRPGVIGEYHGNTGDQMAAVVGLSMVSGISNVMVQRESLGQSLMPTPKATIQNGLYSGLSNVTQMEANRQMNKLGSQPSYVTIDAGSDLIITLSSTYYETDN